MQDNPIQLLLKHAEIVEPNVLRNFNVKLNIALPAERANVR